MPGCKPDVSVVVTYHNEGELLGRALQSIEDLVFDGEIEVIVVDDASDLPPRLPDRFRFPVRLVRSERNVYSATARNIGLENASGRFVCFLDADDVYLPNKLAAQVPLLLQDRAIAAVGGRGYLHRDGEVRLKTPSVVEECYAESASSPFVFPRRFCEDICAYYGFYTHATLFDREALQSIGGFDTSLRFFEEWDLLVRIARRHEVAYVPDAVCRYLCRNNDSLTTFQRPEKYATSALMFRRWRRQTKGLSPLYKRRLMGLERQYHLWAAQIYLDAEGQPGTSLVHSLRSLMCGPSVWGFRSTVRSGLHCLLPRPAMESVQAAVQLILPGAGRQ